MSIEWFIGSFEIKEEQNIPIENIMNIFSEYTFEINYDFNCIDIRLSGEIVYIYFKIYEKEISHLAISRPSGNMELKKTCNYSGVFSIASVIFM
ncbi:MAG: hypothetical protein LBK27_00820 [Treponema sp.]|nr:hypothetical protein [Treponema sp.]